MKKCNVKDLGRFKLQIQTVTYICTSKIQRAEIAPPKYVAILLQLVLH